MPWASFLAQRWKYSVMPPLGDPMQIKVGGSFVSIRRAEAEIISVEIQ